MDLKLKGKKALVMGSSAGIGKAIAKSLIAEGVEAALCARSEEKLAKAASDLGAPCHFVCDLSQKGAAPDVIRKTAAALGGLDILVINSGGPKKGKFLDVPLEQWHED